MDRYLYSKALAEARQSDFAHPGGQDSVDILKAMISHEKHMSILDFGCGLGGTVGYLSELGYSNLYGIDINAESVSYASRRYGGGKFFSSIGELSQSFENKEAFATIYAINVFYLIEDKDAILKQLETISCKNTQVLISDFSINQKKLASKDIDRLSTYVPFPFVEKEEKAIVSASNWVVVDVNDLSAHYLSWYQFFVQQILERKTQIITQTNEHIFDYMLEKYVYFCKVIENGCLGGAIYKLTPRE